MFQKLQKYPNGINLLINSYCGHFTVKNNVHIWSSFDFY